MRTRRLAAALAVGSLAVFGFAACGGDDEESAAAPAGTQTQTETMPAESGGQDIVTLAQGNEDLSTLVQAVTAADLVKTLQGEGPFTVLAPTNDAFAALGQDALDTLLAPESKDQLTDVLAYHVVEGEVMSSDLKDGQEVRTLQGGTLTVSIDGDTVRIGDATVVQPDVDASNGVVHVIDAVLQPPS